MRDRVRLKWSDESKDDIRKITRFYKSRNPAAGKRIVREIRTQSQIIKSNPFIGLNTSEKGVQRLLIANTTYFVVYELLPSEEAPEIASILYVISSLEDTKARKYL